jgi:hypothetical protein
MVIYHAREKVSEQPIAPEGYVKRLNEGTKYWTGEYLVIVRIFHQFDDLIIRK